ncbi:acetylornithine transaminase [Agromyces bracchium]|uniref:Acetylornithine transaminase n=1 Tax=Agromyces bracchium TaxID=88376 RepID=A0A6I3MA09_9MICO|nr:acetylornithine transaminase [Agromyces bracchium]
MMKTLGSPLAKLVRGEGARVQDDEGTWYLDFLAGIAVNSLGHAHPVFVDAVTRQASRLAHVSNYFATDPALALADRLARISGAGEAGRVWFGNSGAEANEAAFKLARLNNSGGARTRVLALVDAFHGRTMGSLALTGKPAMRDAFEPLPGGVTHIPSTIEALEAELDESVAALILEPIKGEAGVLELPEGYLRAARDLTRRHGALLIVDEVQTGAGRTGEWFAFQHAGIVPDAITVAKGMGGGIPIGGLVTFGHASDLYSRGQHGSTYGGNPLSTAVADAVLAEIERAGLVENAARRGAELRERVLGLGSPLVAGMRGRGLLAGVALTEPVASELSAAAMQAGLIVNAANDSTIRLAPPLIIGDAELDEFTDRFGRALDAVAATR